MAGFLVNSARVLPMEEGKMHTAIALAIAVLLGVATPVAAATSTFPKPPALEPRVDFWKRIYTEVDTRSGLLHDARNLAIVYETVSLPPGLSMRARERRTRARKRHYRQVLRSLASGKRKHLSSEERRVLSLFPPNVSNRTLRRASERIRFQLGQADKFRSGLVRMGRWEGYIRRVFAERGLPSQLVALPHVESSYNPDARSHVGASGIWQFTRSTGRLFLHVDRAVDERNDPFLATVAAARLLKRNYDDTGTWPLAITSYNHGSAGIRRAVRKLGTRDIDTIIDRYQSRSFGFASRNFYSEFLAATEIEEDAERWFGVLPRDAAENPEIIVLEHYYRPISLTRAFGLTREALREANPALLPSVWNGTKYVPKGYALRIPRDAARAAPRVVLASVPASERRARQVPDRRYRIKRGDTLGRIAQRFGLRQSDLIRVNGIRNRHRIRVGQILTLPIRGRARRGPVVAKLRPAPVPANGLYRLRHGDTLWQLARRFGVGEGDLRAVNHIGDPRRVRAGQVLQIPSGANTARNRPGGTPGVYTVRRGDTLDGIARRFGVTQHELVAQNGIRNRHRIRIGQRLFVPRAEEEPRAAAQ